jgi:ethanolamine ammonia-lyase small subunit
MNEPIRDPWSRMKTLTPARIALGRAGGSLPTKPLLDFQFAHARARDAGSAEFDAEHLKSEISDLKSDCLIVHSAAAADSTTFLLRPDLGRRLDEDNRDLLKHRANPASDLAIIISDGLSALAVQRHAVPLLRVLLPMLTPDTWNLAPIIIACRGRVAIQDEIGELLNAKIALILIGERPGLGAPDSLGAYLVYGPKPGLTDAQRNCVSNIRPEGLSYESAARTLHYLLTQSRHHRLSGIGLKDDSHLLLG